MVVEEVVRVAKELVGYQRAFGTSFSFGQGC
jgi:hypothetical protein